MAGEYTVFQQELDEVLVNYEQKTARDVNRLLRETAMTIAVAEDITAGIVARNLMGDGSRNPYFVGSVICPGKLSKMTLCGVEPATLGMGLVSEKVAIEMAVGIKKRVMSKCSLAVIGAMDEEKKTGLIYIGWSINDTVKATPLSLDGTNEFALKAAIAALDILKQRLHALKEQRHGTT